MATISLPTMILIIDNNIDVSIILEVSEEEEQYKEITSLDILELNIQENSPSWKTTLNLNKKNYSNYRFKNYTNPQLNLISPPPDLQA